MAQASRAAPAPARRRLLRQEAIDGYLFATPFIVGLLVWGVGPIIASFYLSFTEYDIVKPPVFVGLSNFIRLFTEDEYFKKSLLVTTYYSVVSVPLSLTLGFLVAVLMNQKVKGVVVFRAIWYLPALVPAIANGALWKWVLNQQFGLVNVGLRLIGLPGPGWLVDPQWTVPSLILVHLWGLGSSMLIYLAGLQGIPQHLFEAVEIDGGGWWQKFRHVTLPMISPVVFFNFILGIIGSFQVFTIVYIIFTGDTPTTPAGPENAALFYVLYLYRNAFNYFRMGYASSLAWILTAIIIVLTVISFRFSRTLVYYEGIRWK